MRDGDGSGDRRAKPYFGWYALKLSAVMFAVFIVTSAYPQAAGPFVLVSSEVISRPWTIVTYIFLHASFAHISSNLFVLLLFGLIFEKVAGSRNFLLVFFSAGIFSGMAGVFFYDSMVGASGAIFGVIGALTIIAPKMVVPAFGIPIPLAVAAILWLALDIGGVFYPSDVGNIGHIAGLAWGIAMGAVLRPEYAIAGPTKWKNAELDEDYFRWWEENYLRPANARKKKARSG